MIVVAKATGIPYIQDNRLFFIARGMPEGSLRPPIFPADILRIGNVIPKVEYVGNGTPDICPRCNRPMMHEHLRYDSLMREHFRHDSFWMLMVRRCREHTDTVWLDAFPKVHGPDYRDDFTNVWGSVFSEEQVKAIESGELSLAAALIGIRERREAYERLLRSHAVEMLLTPRGLEPVRKPFVEWLRQYMPRPHVRVLNK